MTKRLEMASALGLPIEQRFGRAGHHIDAFCL